MFDLNGLGIMAAILYAAPNLDLTEEGAAARALEIANEVTRAATKQNAEIEQEQLAARNGEMASADAPAASGLVAPDGSPATSKPNLTLLK